MDPTAKFLACYLAFGALVLAFSIGPRELAVMQSGARRRGGDWWLAGLVLGLFASLITWPFQLFFRAMDWHSRKRGRTGQ